MRRSAVLCGLLVVLAGCNAPFSPAGQPTPTPTPAATPTASPTPSGTPLPDPRDVGLAADGVVEPLALRNAHVRSLENRSYTLRRSVTVRRPDGTVVVRFDQRVESGPHQDHFVWNRSRDVADGLGFWLEDLYGETRAERAYSNGTMTVVEVVAFGDREVARYDEVDTSQTPFTGPYRDFTGRQMVMRTFLQVDTRVTEIDRERGTVRYHLVADRGPHDLEVNTPFEVEPRLLSLTATVERSGLVRSIVLRYALTHENETVVVREVLRISAVDETTVTEPPWVDAVAAEAADDDRAAGRFGAVKPPVSGVALATRSRSRPSGPRVHRAGTSVRRAHASP